MNLPAAHLVACNIAILLVVTSLSQNTFAQNDSPKWNLKKGDAFSVSLVQTSKSETKVQLEKGGAGARTVTIDNDTIVEMDWNVVAIAENGDATIDQALTRVKLSVSGFTRIKAGDAGAPVKEVLFDTAAPAGVTNDSKTLLKQVQPLLGLKFSVVMSPQGEIKEVEVSKEVAEQLEKMPDTQRLRALFSKAGWKDMLGASAMVLPADLSAGKTWDVEATMDSALGKLNRKRTYTYNGERDVDGRKLAEFSLNVALDVPESSSSVDDTLKSKLVESSGSGTLFMDLAEGFLKSSKIESRIHTEKPYREKKISTIVTTEIETTVSKK